MFQSLSSTSLNPSSSRTHSFSMHGSPLMDFEKRYPSLLILAYAMFCAQLRSLSATSIKSCRRYCFSFSAPTTSVITGFSDSFPGYIFIPTGIWLLSSRRPNPRQAPSCSPCSGPFFSSRTPCRSRSRSWCSRSTSSKCQRKTWPLTAQ